MAGASERRRLLSALLLSALVHLLAGGGIPWPVTHPDDLPVPPIAARLEAPPAPPAGPPQTAASPPPRAATARPAITATPPAEVHMEPSPAVSFPSPAGTAPVADPEPEPLPPEPEPVPAEVVPTPPAPLHPQLPGGFTVRYVVQGNEDGLVLGQLEHIWQRSSDRYALTALARATGIVRLFYSGLLSQTSYGQITDEGLKPENYWMQRGSRQLKVHFDWEGMRADLGDRYPALELKAGSQDLLSVIYQLALFPDPAEDLWVLDGKTIKQYHLESLGVETVQIPLGAVQTRHLRVQASQGAERIDVWLRATPPHLPLKIHMQGSRNGSAVLLAEAIHGLDAVADQEAASSGETVSDSD